MEDERPLPKRKFKILDTISHAHQFCTAVDNNKLSPAEAVEEFKPINVGASSDGLVQAYGFADGSVMTQAIALGRCLTKAHDRGVSVPDALQQAGKTVLQ